MKRVSVALVGTVAWLFMFAGPSALHSQTAARKKVDFVHEVRPILKESCYKCHGPDKKKASLRLDIKALAMKGGENGPVIIPGQSEKSPLVQRLISTDDDQRMPQKANALSPTQIALIRDWIDQGA